jgi:hypothetical protein
MIPMCFSNSTLIAEPSSSGALTPGNDDCAGKTPEYEVTFPLCSLAEHNKSSNTQMTLRNAVLLRCFPILQPFEIRAVPSVTAVQYSASSATELRSWGCGWRCDGPCAAH